MTFRALFAKDETKPELVATFPCSAGACAAKPDFLRDEGEDIVFKRRNKWGYYRWRRICRGLLRVFCSRRGEAVRTDKLAQILEEDEQTVQEQIGALTAFYNEQKRGFAIIEIDGGYQICTRPEYYTYVQAMAGMKRQQGAVGCGV